MDKKKQNIFAQLFSSIGRMFGRLFSFGGQNYIAADELMSPRKMAYKNFIRNKLAMFGLILFVIMTLTVTIGSAMNPVNFGENEPSLRHTAPGKNNLKIPNALKKAGIKKIATGVSYSIGLSDEGKLYFWGTATEGVNKFPKEVIENKVVDVVSGDRHVIAQLENGEFIGWGLNAFEQATVPLAVKTSIGKERFKKMIAGDQYSGVLTEAGKAYVWGSTLNTKLNIVPKAIQGRIVDFVPTSFNIFYILDDGSIAMNGLRGQTLETSIPAELKDGSVNVVQVASTQGHGLALDDKGKMYLWGSTSEPEGHMPAGLENEKIISISAGKKHFAVVTEAGKVVSWGSSKQNQINTKPTDGKEYESVYASYYQTYAFDSQGNATGFGFKGFTLGSDDMGRDIAIRLLHGGRITMFVGVIAVLISTVIGVTVGLISGFYGGWIDNILMRFAEIVSSFPFLPLAITLSTIMVDKLSQSQRLTMVMVILGVISWPGLARMIRGQILAEREKDFVLAARALGLPTRKIIMKHILPAVFNIIIVTMTLGYAGNLLTESGLSFLGFGVGVPQPSWGNMLSNSQSARVIEFYWWEWFLPAMCVLLAALSVNLVGDGLRDALDPKSNEK